jgi:hypothetical protein
MLDSQREGVLDLTQSQSDDRNINQVIPVEMNSLNEEEYGLPRPLYHEASPERGASLRKGDIAEDTK